MQDVDKWLDRAPTRIFAAIQTLPAVDSSENMTNTSNFFAHESSCIDQPCQIGEGTRIWHFSHVMPGARIGANCILGQNVFVDRDVVVGRDCKIQNNVSLYSGVQLADGVFCGPSVVFTNVINPRARIERKHEFKATLVGEEASLGANATLVCGVTIGAYAFVGAGAVVTRDVAPYAVVYGVPARRNGWVCQCGVLLPDRETALLNCSSCAKEYRQEAGGLTLET
jgi:UDP-2-acetamido-3-amino-2,3-dideoxy-glucuronate N-acetyltransferase